MTNIRKFITCLFVLALFAPALYAQVGGYSGAFSRMGFGAKGMSMSNAMSSVTATEFGAHSYYNPAIAATILDDDENSINQKYDLSTAVMEFDRNMYMASASFEIPPSAGLSLNLLSSTVSDLEERSQSGYYNGTFDAVELQFQGNFGIAVSKLLKLGIGIKMNYANYHPDADAAYGMGLDAGFILTPLSNWNLSLAVKDVLTSYRWNVDDIYGTDSSNQQIDEVPTRLILGTSYFLDKYNLLLSLDFENLIATSDVQEKTFQTFLGYPSYRTSESTITGSSQKLSFGTRYRAHEFISVSGGYSIHNLSYMDESDSFSAGFSLHLPLAGYSPTVDYAFVSEPGGFSSFHVLSLSINL
jgi:hypothetical protein